MPSALEQENDENMPVYLPDVDVLQRKLESVFKAIKKSKHTVHCLAPPNLYIASSHDHSKDFQRVQLTKLPLKTIDYVVESGELRADLAKTSEVIVYAARKKGHYGLNSDVVNLF